MAIDTQCDTLILTDENGNQTGTAIVRLDNRAAKEAKMIEIGKAYFHYGADYSEYYERFEKFDKILNIRQYNFITQHNTISGADTGLELQAKMSALWSEKSK